MIEDVIAIDRGVDDRELFERFDCRFHEQRHEPQLHAMAFFKIILVAGAQIHQGLHVHFVERGENRRLLLGL